MTEATRGEVAMGSPACAAGADGGGSPANGGSKRISKLRSPASGGGASSTAAAIKHAAGSPPRKKRGLSPNHGASPAPEEMDGLDDDDDDDVQHDGDSANGGAEAANPYGKTEVLRCSYLDLQDTIKPTKSQMMATDGSERSSDEVKTDGKRVEEKLLSAHRRRRIFDHGRTDLDPTG